MHLVPTHRLPADARLAQDVRLGRPDGTPWLRAGVRLEAGYRDRLLGEGVRAVWIDDEASRGIEPEAPISEETRRQTASAVGYAFEEAGRRAASPDTLSSPTVSELARVADLIRDDVLDCPAVALALTDLATVDAYTHAHSVNVAVTGTLIGRQVLETHGWVDRDGHRRLDRRKWRLSRLALGLLLHDLGKLSVPTTVLDKPGRLDPDEWALVRQHPEAGLCLLSRGVPPLAREVVRSHHERWDGTGYPRGLSGTEIHQLARIAAIADVYDAVTSERAYAEAEPPHVGVRVVQAGAGSQFDPAVVESFTQVVMPYPPGHEIELEDGRIGIVASVDPRRPYCPVVRAPVQGGFEEVEMAMTDSAIAA